MLLRLPALVGAAVVLDHSGASVRILAAYSRHTGGGFVLARGGLGHRPILRPFCHGAPMPGSYRHAEINGSAAAARTADFGRPLLGPNRFDHDTFPFRVQNLGLSLWSVRARLAKEAKLWVGSFQQNGAPSTGGQGRPVLSTKDQTIFTVEIKAGIIDTIYRDN